MKSALKTKGFLPTVEMTQAHESKRGFFGGAAAEKPPSPNKAAVFSSAARKLNYQ